MSGKSKAKLVGRFGLGMTVLSVVLSPAAFAGLSFAPNFDTSITSNSNAAAIEAAINIATSDIGSLFSNDMTVPVDFTYNPAAPTNLLSTSQAYGKIDYATYVNALTQDLSQHPTNTVLASALASLPLGNDANGSGLILITVAQINMLGLSQDFGCGNACVAPITININSTQNFSLSEPTPGNQFDLIGGLEHELDETLGGGGGGSMLNAIAAGACNPNSALAFFCGYGGLDLLRYSAPGTPSFTTDPSASAYLSIDGGVTSIVAFNQDSNGDFGDFAPPCAVDPSGQIIQNAFNCTGQDETYSTSSQEYAMLQAIGWDAAVATPEPGTIALFGAGLMLIGIVRRSKV